MVKGRRKRKKDKKLRRRRKEIMIYEWNCCSDGLGFEQRDFNIYTF